MSQEKNSFIIDNRTDTLDLPLPHKDNDLFDDADRLRDSLAKIDTYAKERQEKDAAHDAAFATQIEAEQKARADSDNVLQQNIDTEIQARIDGDVALVAALEIQAHAHAAALTAQAQNHESALQEEAQQRTADLEEERTTRAQQMQEHDAALDCHDSLVKRITVGGLSPVIGIVCVEEGGGAGTWFNCDVNGQPVSPPRSYFDYHPTYNALRKVLVDGQMMVEHKKFYYKAMIVPSGVFRGKKARIISPEAQEGFKVFPSFMKNGEEIYHWYCGVFSATDEGGTPKKLGSRPGKYPFVNVNFPTMQGYCNNRNVNGVVGFQMIDIYQFSELQLLALVEAGTTDTQAMYGRGRVDAGGANKVDATDVATATWRGHIGLWGNVWQMVDGLRLGAGGKVEIWDNMGNRAWCNTNHIQPTGAPTYSKKTKSGRGSGFDFDDVFVMEVSAGATDATYPDYYYNNNATGNIVYLGGDWDSGSGAGLFCLNFNGATTSASTDVGCRLAKT